MNSVVKRCPSITLLSDPHVSGTQFLLFKKYVELKQKHIASEISAFYDGKVVDADLDLYAV
jgi:hypothetical protein